MAGSDESVVDAVVHTALVEGVTSGGLAFAGGAEAVSECLAVVGENVFDGEGGFVHWYNEEHRHSTIRFVTPGQRHRGEDIAILVHRHRVYQIRYALRPHKKADNYVGKHRPPHLPKV